MSAIVVCLDCPLYQKGGFCRRTRKDVGALQPACEESQKDSFKQFCNDMTTENTPKQDPAVRKVTDPVPTEKVCSKCGETKPASEFYTDRFSPDGLKYWCKHCTRVAAAKHAREKRAQMKADRAAAPAETAPETPQPELKEMKPQDPKDSAENARHMVDALRAQGWEVTCRRTRTYTITEEL